LSRHHGLSPRPLHQPAFRGASPGRVVELLQEIEPDAEQIVVLSRLARSRRPGAV
jgi:hypothetical protein